MEAWGIVPLNPQHAVAIRSLSTTVNEKKYNIEKAKRDNDNYNERIIKNERVLSLSFFLSISYMILPNNKDVCLCGVNIERVKMREVVVEAQSRRHSVFVFWPLRIRAGL